MSQLQANSGSADVWATNHFGRQTIGAIPCEDVRMDDRGGRRQLRDIRRGRRHFAEGGI